MNVAGLDLCRLGVHARRLIDLGPERNGVRYCLVLGEDPGLGRPAAHVLDHDRVCDVLPRLVDDQASELRVSKLRAQKVDKIEILALHQPGGAHRVVAELSRLRRDIPTLNDRVTGLACRQLIVRSKPLPSNDLTLKRDGSLLILRGEVETADRLLDTVQVGFRLSRFVKEFPWPFRVKPVGCDADALLGFSDRREAEVNPRLLSRTWPVKSSISNLCMIRMITSLRLLSKREYSVRSNHSLTAERLLSDIASSGLMGSSMIMKLPPRPVSVPPTEVEYL